MHSIGTVFYRFVVLAVTVMCVPTALADDPARTRPNIIIMLSDNLGYGDIGAYGGGVIRGAPTPRLDALAAEGIRFTNFNVEAECTPSRSALMTGRYAVRSGTTRAVPVPGMPQGLAPWEVTLAEMLKSVGYQTALFGKWHIGTSPGRLPTDQGFDQWWGFPNSTDVARFSTVVGFDASTVPPLSLYEGTAADGVKPVEKYTLARRPTIDETIEQRTVDYIRAHADDREPFFLFVSWSLVHHPSIPHPDFAGRTGHGAFADVVVEHDYRVGRVLDAIDEAGISRNTLVIYASDNGPDRAEFPLIGDTGPFRGYLGSVHEGSIRTPMLVRWPGHVPEHTVTNEMVSIHDVFPSIAAIVGGKMPADRAVDGVDQSPLWLGQSGESARSSVLLFHDMTLMAVKWKQFKIYLQHEGVDREDTRYAQVWAPLAYNLVQDPKESHNIIHEGYLWLVSPLLRELMPFLASVKQYGLVSPGGETPEPGKIDIPFFPEEATDRALQSMAEKSRKN